MKIDILPFVNKDTPTAESQRERPPLEGGPGSKTEETGKGDVVQLSERSKMIAKARELAAQAPEVRDERVNDLKKRIAAGTYNISGRVVAEDMLKKSITEV